jgi:hypothetical protein
VLGTGDSSSALVKCEKQATMCLGSLVQCVTRRQVTAARLASLDERARIRQVNLPGPRGW